MEWLNYHHLRYFWTVAREGSLARAAAKLHVSQPAISEQIHELEEALGEKLFRREGRTNRLTDAGQVVLGYAEEIFKLGRELVQAVKQHPGARELRLYVGVVDSFPKLVTNEILAPVFTMARAVHVICREGKMPDLLGQLAAHRLDLVLADEPPSSTVNIKTFCHQLGETSATFCAGPRLAAKLKRGFPRSLNGAPALLPAENTPFRRALEQWFRDRHLSPRIVAEFDDLALMKVMAAEERGFIAVPTVALQDACARYGFRAVGRASDCRLQFHAVTVERRIAHPAVGLITQRRLRDSDLKTRPKTENPNS
ncbi:MAG: LysR family transcriptional regulator [Verrucomicrobiae bacterium]|nr:LysR family transcriptional regulator [Verrucomicrobiae bacterium]MDW8309036.1 LysR family transcriptional regulator [Verrucomicrobiales bacterium]